jgi:beta-phosphoglucomutase
VIRAVVFDFDGVIANSEPLHFRAFAETLAEEGVMLSEHDYYGRYLGYDDFGVFRAVHRDQRLGWNTDRIADLVKRKAVRLEALERDTSVLFPGADAAIRRLAAALPLAIASGALREEIQRVLDRSGLSRCFGAVVSAEDTPASKPAPDPYIRAVNLLGTVTGRLLDPADCVAIEDSHWGLESARAAGLHTIAVTHTYTADALREADLVIPNLEALVLSTLDTFGTG